MDKRVDEIDILKALAIICMVLGHSGCPFTHFFYLFHMAVFFIASGYFFKNKYSDSVKSVLNFIINKYKKLVIPYLIWNAIFTLLNNVFININVYTNNYTILEYLDGQYVTTHKFLTFSKMFKNIIKGFYFEGVTTEGGAFWFLQILFMLSCGYCIGNFLIRKFFGEKYIFEIQTFFSILFLVIGYNYGLKGDYHFGIPQCLSCYFLYHFGYYFNMRRKKINKNNELYVVLLIVSFISLLILNNCGSIELNANKYTNPLFLCFVSLLGWYFLYSISVLLNSSMFKNLFIYIGKRTMSILILHFLSMKVVAFIVCIYYELPLFCVAAHPNLYGERGLWWVLYTIAGIVLPLLMEKLINNIYLELIKYKNLYK